MNVTGTIDPVLSAVGTGKGLIIVPVDWNQNGRFRFSQGDYVC